MKKVMMVFLYVLKVQLSLLNVAMADTCPLSPLKIQPKLQSLVEFNKKTNLYTYSYILENEKTSALPISIIRLILKEAPTEIKTPGKWHGSFNTLNEPKDFIFSSMFAIKPGDSMKDFSFASPLPPGVVFYYTIGDTGIPTTSPIPGNDEPVPDCPGFFYDRPFLEGYINGVTIGPIPPNQISIDFKLKKIKEIKKDRKEEDEDFTETSPKKDTGKVVVIIKNSKDLDIDSIKISSMKLGTGQAPVESSKIVGERKLETLRMVFDLQKLGIVCDRDRVLFLVGKTNDGKDLLGAEPIRTKDCDESHDKKKQDHK